MNASKMAFPFRERSILNENKKKNLIKELVQYNLKIVIQTSMMEYDLFNCSKSIWSESATVSQKKFISSKNVLTMTFSFNLLCASCFSLRFLKFAEICERRLFNMTVTSPHCGKNSCVNDPHCDTKSAPFKHDFVSSFRKSTMSRSPWRLLK